MFLIQIVGLFLDIVVFFPTNIYLGYEPKYPYHITKYKQTNLMYPI